MSSATDSYSVATLTRIVTPPPEVNVKPPPSASPASVMSAAELVAPKPRLHTMLAGNETLALDVLNQLSALAEFLYVEGIDADEVPHALLHCTAI